MPTQDRARRKQRADLLELLPAKDLALYGKSPALGVAKQNLLLAELLYQDLVFGSEVLDRFLLLSFDPSSKNHEEELLRLKDEAHGVPGLVDS